MYTGIYGNIEKDLLEINFFRSYKDKVCRMSDAQAMDLYNGVIIPYVYLPRMLELTWYAKLIGHDSRVKHLFETIEDWYTLDFACKKCENKFNMNGVEFVKWRIQNMKF